jgi:hypothetical protein
MKVIVYPSKKHTRLICCNTKMRRLYVGSSGFFALNKVICLKCGKIKTLAKTT